MIKSMTGFAAATAAAGSLTATAEVRSVNSRSLDLLLRLPPGCSDLEERIRSMVAGRLSRGRVELRIQIEDAAEAAATVEADLPRARSVQAALERIRSELGLEDRISLELLVAAGGMLKAASPSLDLEAVGRLLERCLSEVLDGLDAMRAAEGRNLAVDLEARLAAVQAALQEVARLSDGQAAAVQERLKERIATLTQGLVELDPGRMAQEAAFLADRADISEELTRAESHLSQFRAIMQASEPAGRKLNFLLQELNREFNTMASKIGNAAASHLIVDVKTELEKIREQIQNVE